MKKDPLAIDYFSFDYPGNAAFHNVLRSVSTTIFPVAPDPDFSLPMGYSDSHLSPTFNSSVCHVIEDSKTYILKCWSALSFQEQQLQSAPLAASSTGLVRSNLQEALGKLEFLVNLLDHYARLAVKCNSRDVPFQDRKGIVDKMAQVQGQMRGLIEFLSPIVGDSTANAS